MKKIICLVFAVGITSLVKTSAQCNVNEVLTICDMTIIDGDSNGTPDGIINLYDEYNSLTGNSISLSDGVWFDPNFNFALDASNGDLYLWDLDYASLATDDYQFQFIDTSSSCPNGVVITLNVVLGPFEGRPLPAVGPNDANVTICETILSDFDLFQVFESQPSPHENGTWAFVGNLGDPGNFVELTQDGVFSANIPYVPGGNLIEFDVFEFTYTVPGITPCSPSRVSNFKVEVIRDVQSGTATTFDICESDILAGLWDADINLRDDAYLVGEDIEGLWSSDFDPTGQISNPLDSVINLREVYDDLITTNSRFGCQQFEYHYTVEARSTLSDCSDKTSTIVFNIYEDIRPFSQAQPVEFCEDSAPNNYNLLNELEFTSSGGFTYSYTNNECTNWELISGSSALGLVSNSGNICSLESPVDDQYTYQGTIDLSNITNADAGTYVFRYTVSPNFHCSNLSSSCGGEFADVTVIIHPKFYAGEDTSGAEFCETDPVVASSVDLFSLMTTNGTDDPIYQGAEGTWIDTATGLTITTPYTLPEINDQQTFNFLYTTLTPNGCLDRASLSFTVYEAYQAGAGDVLDICDTTRPVDLFNSLSGNPNTTGTWSGPNGYISTGHNAIFDPLISEGGIYTYTVPDNGLCTGNQTTLSVVIHQSPNAGSDMLGTVCRSDSQIDLMDYLDSLADDGGTFVDIDNTNVLSGSIVDVAQLGTGTYNFRYEIQGHVSCELASALIAITVQEVAPAITDNQTFCANEGARVLDLEASGAVDYNWYENITDTTPLPLNHVLVDGEDYFVAALDTDGCESPRVSAVVTILPLNHVDCEDCIKDGISVNGDGLNDEFDLCNLPISFPNFQLEIFNRYGALVYKGSLSTELFKGISNVSSTMGNELPTGVYFYVFSPMDGQTKPFQGNLYLSR